MKSIYKGGQFQTGDFAQILTGVYILFSLDHDKPAYFRILPGSINSAASLRSTMDVTRRGNIVLAADTAFYSRSNTEALSGMGGTLHNPLEEEFQADRLHNHHGQAFHVLGPSHILSQTSRRQIRHVHLQERFPEGGGGEELSREA